MKKLIAILILLCMLTSLAACKKKNGTNEDPETENEEGTSSDEKKEEPEDPVPTVIVPEYKDYGRGSADFSTIIYTRPGIEALVASFEAVTRSVANSEGDVASQIEDIRALEAPLSNAKAMYSLVKINHSKSTSNEFWQDESVYMGINYPLLTQAVEKLMVACASSENKAVFESDYFGYSIDKYVNGGIYTDTAVSLMQAEAELENEYASLSTATVVITYTSIGLSEPITATVDEVKAQLRQHYGNDTAAYNNALNDVNNYYKQKLGELSKPIFVELIRVRRLLANELGYKSYTELAYRARGYDYTPDDILSLLDEIGKYVYDVTATLTDEIFSGYAPQKFSLDSVTLMNTLYEVYSEMGGVYKDAYSYMLQHGLYDVAPKADGRYDSSFTVYLPTNASPYIYAATSSALSDYTLLSHEFGHFLDAYVNYGEEDDETVMEISSKTMELITLLKLKNTIYTPEYKYLNYLTTSGYLYGLLSDSFYALFEHMVYSLSYDEITAEKLEELVDEAYTVIYTAIDDTPSLSNKPTLVNMLNADTILSPCRTESYVTSTLVSLDIFLQEGAVSGAGISLYEALISRDEIGLSFTQRLDDAGIDHPFTTEKVKDVAGRIYRYLTGKDYTFSSDTDNA